MVWATACGGTTRIGQQGVSDEGGGATSASGSAGEPTAATGGVRASGGRASGGSAAGASGGFILASGGSGAGGSGGFVTNGGSGGQQNLCLDSDGRLRPGLKNCSSDADCGILHIERCCGSDLEVGLSYDSNCVVPGVDCSGVDCAKSPYGMAEDGLSGPAMSARCEVGDSGQGTCRSFVVMPEDGGTTSQCGVQTCSDNQLCALPPTNVPGQGSPYCVDVPPGCSAPLTCDCFAPDVCGGGAKFCYSIAGRAMQCLFAP